MTVAVCLALLVPSTAGAKLSVVGGTDARTVELEPTGTAGTLAGDLRLPLESDERTELTIRYLPAGANATVDLPGASDPRIALVAPEQRPLVLTKGVLTVVTLRFTLPKGADPDSLDGTIFLQNKKGGRTPIPVKFQPAALTGVAVEPAKVEIQCESPGDCEVGKVLLRGSGVPGFVAAHKDRTFPLTLRAGTREADAVLKEITGDANDPLLASATLEVTDKGRLGRTFSGSVPLASGGQKPPTVEAQVKHRGHILLAILVVVLGVLVGGVAPRLRALERRRRLLKRKLDEAESEYIRRQGDIGTRPDSYDLADLLDPKGGDELGTVSKLRLDIDSARNDADLEEDTGRVLDVVARIMRWLRIEPAALRLRKIVAIDPAHGTDAWHATNTVAESRAVLDALRSEPKDAAAADDIVARTLGQVYWHHRFRRAWDAFENDQAKTARLMALDAELGALAGLVAENKSVLERTEADRHELHGKLNALTLGLPDLTPPTLAALEVQMQADPNWGTAALNFRGWAPYGGGELKQVTARARRSGRGGEKRGAGDVAGDALRLLVGDVAWTLLAIVAASTIYVLTLYDDDWGSAQEFLTAFVAGFGTLVVIDLTAQPLFQSIRLRLKG